MTIQKIKFRHIYWGFFYLAIFSYILFNSFNYLDPDLGWHLRVGENILTEKAVPGPDYYNYTLEGQNWIDHEWLSDLITFLIYNNFGYIILSLFFALIFFSTLIILHAFAYYNFADNKKSYVVFSFFIFLGAIAIAPHSGVRIQEIGLFNILSVLIILFYYSKNKNFKILFALPPLFFLWASLHASFVLGIFILFFFPIIKSIEILLKKYNFFSFLSFSQTLNLKELFIYLIFAAFSAATVLFTPYGLKIIYLFNQIHISGAFFLKIILEWLPAYSLPINYYQLLYTGIASAVLILFLFFSITEKNSPLTNTTKQYKINLWFFCLSLLFLFLAFKSKRNFPFFFVASFPLIINFSGAYFNVNNNKIKYYIYNNTAIKVFVILGLILASTILIIKTNFTSHPFESKKYCSKLPCAAVDFLKNNAQYKDLKLFNEYSWGGYLIWSWPGKKIFIDGRLPQHPLADHTLLEEYYEFFKEQNSENKLNEYDIQAVLINKPKDVKLNWYEEYILGFNKNKIYDKKNFFRAYLNSAESWKKDYEDETSIIYIKNENS